MHMSVRGAGSLCHVCLRIKLLGSKLLYTLNHLAQPNYPLLHSLRQSINIPIPFLMPSYINHESLRIMESESLGARRVFSVQLVFHNLQKKMLMGMMVSTCNLSGLETEAGGSCLLGPCRLQYESLS